MKKGMFIIIVIFMFADKVLAAPLTGTIKMWSSTTIPTGYLLCDGRTVSRTAYADLFKIIGTTYGAGDGSTTFNLPNMGGRSVVGKSSSKALANTGGSTSVTLSASNIPSHSHSIPALSGTAASAGAHQHYVDPAGTTAYLLTFGNSSVSNSWDNVIERGFEWKDTTILNYWYYEWGKGRVTTVASSGDHTHNVTTNASTTGSTGATTTVSVENPYTVINYIIKY